MRLVPAKNERKDWRREDPKQAAGEGCCDMGDNSRCVTLADIAPPWAFMGLSQQLGLQ